MNMSFNAVVIYNQRVNENLFILRVQPVGSLLPDFKPGQFATLGLPSNKKWIRRAYSIASPVKEKNFLEFYIVKVTDGRLTVQLHAMKPGDSLWLGPKPAGHFTLDPVERDKDLWLIATGTGLGPYMSMIRSIDLGKRQKTTLIHGVRYSEDLGYFEELKTLSQEREGLTYIPIVSRPSKTWKGYSGRIPQSWPSLLKESNSSYSPDSSHIFLCGNPEMIKEMTSLLKKDGFKMHSRKESGQIHTEKYW